VSQVSRRSARGWSRFAGKALAAIVLAATLVSGCGGGSSAVTGGSGRFAFAGTALTPVRSAPALASRNYLGDPVTLSHYRGKAVLVTFLYTHCIDVCPLIAANLGVALDRLGLRARQVQVIAVSVDPRGDKPKTVAAFLKAHRMAGRMKYLIGTAGQLAPIWKAWHVAAVRNPVNHRLVTHSSVTYGVSATGKLMTVYGPNLQPAQIVHDVPRLIST
jgi:protein SCO1/2